MTSNDATPATPPPTTYPSNPLMIFFYVAIFLLWLGPQLISIHYTIQVLAIVTSILYVACHNSIELLHSDNSATSDGKKNKSNKPKMAAETETLKKEDAMQFPLVGSASLFGLYLAFKFLDPDMVNIIISVYFALMGIAALTMTVAPVLSAILPVETPRVTKTISLAHPLPEWVGGPSPWDLSVDATLLEMVTGLGAVVFGYFYFKTKHWAMNNVFGICFCLQGISKFSLGSYKIGAILLTGLFFYDIFWVFGTDVMVTVAKNLDGPIKILFPRSLDRNEDGKLDMSLLGLGDIVIPGFFLALLLRFDAHHAGTNKIFAAFPKPYFHSCLVAYVLGLGLTLFVMIYFEAAQPALLYLVPACLGSSFICALVRGEVKQLLDYSEEADEEEQQVGEEGDQKDTETKKKD